MIEMGCRKYLYHTYIDICIGLEPKDYLNCVSKSEVLEQVANYVNEITLLRHLYYEDSEEVYEIPDEFWEEWEQLKKQA